MTAIPAALRTFDCPTGTFGLVVAPSIVVCRGHLTDVSMDSASKVGGFRFVVPGFSRTKQLTTDAKARADGPFDATYPG